MISKPEQQTIVWWYGTLFFKLVVRCPGARRVEKGLEVEMNARVGLGVGKGVLFRELSSVQECPHRERSTDSALELMLITCALVNSVKGFCPRLQTSYITIPKTPNITGRRVLLVVYYLQH